MSKNGGDSDPEWIPPQRGKRKLSKKQNGRRRSKRLKRQNKRKADSPSERLMISTDEDVDLLNANAPANQQLSQPESPSDEQDVIEIDEHVAVEQCVNGDNDNSSNSNNDNGTPVVSITNANEVQNSAAASDSNSDENGNNDNSQADRDLANLRKEQKKKLSRGLRRKHWPLGAAHLYSQFTKMNINPNLFRAQGGTSEGIKKFATLLDDWYRYKLQGSSNKNNKDPQYRLVTVYEGVLPDSEENWHAHFSLDRLEENQWEYILRSMQAFNVPRNAIVHFLKDDYVSFDNYVETEKPVSPGQEKWRENQPLRSHALHVRIFTDAEWKTVTGWQGYIRYMFKTYNWDVGKMVDAGHAYLTRWTVEQLQAIMDKRTKKKGNNRNGGNDPSEMDIVIENVGNCNSLSQLDEVRAQMEERFNRLPINRGKAFDKVFDSKRRRLERAAGRRKKRNRSQTDVLKEDWTIDDFNFGPYVPPSRRVQFTKCMIQACRWLNKVVQSNNSVKANCLVIVAPESDSGKTTFMKIISQKFVVFPLKIDVGWQGGDYTNEVEIFTIDSATEKHFCDAGIPRDAFEALSMGDPAYLRRRGLTPVQTHGQPVIITSNYDITQMGYLALEKNWKIWANRFEVIRFHSDPAVEETVMPLNYYLMWKWKIHGVFGPNAKTKKQLGLHNVIWRGDDPSMDRLIDEDHPGEFEDETDPQLVHIDMSKVVSPENKIKDINIIWFPNKNKDPRLRVQPNNSVQVHSAVAAEPGVVYYQTKHFTKQQMQEFKDLYDRDPKSAPLVLFGDNVEDNRRPPNTERGGKGGQAKVAGPFDRSFAFGIVTCSLAKDAVPQSWLNEAGERDLQKFDISLKRQLSRVKCALLGGRDVIIPARRDCLCHTVRDYCSLNPDRCEHTDIGDCKHTLGTGLAKMPQEYIDCIAKNLEDLHHVARSVLVIQEVKSYEWWDSVAKFGGFISPYALTVGYNLLFKADAHMVPRLQQLSCKDEWLAVAVVNVTEHTVTFNFYPGLQTFFKNELSMKGLRDFGGGNHNPAVKDLQELEREAWKTWLESDELGQTLTEVPQDPDGHCMFRCLSVALFGDPNKHFVVRLLTVAFLKEHWGRLYGTLARTEMDWTSKAWGEVFHQKAASIMWNFTVYTMGFWPETDRTSCCIRDKAISPNGASMDASNTLVLQYHCDNHYNILQMPGQDFPLACFVDRDVASVNIWQTELFNFGSDNADNNGGVEVTMDIDEGPDNEHENDNNAAANGASNSGNSSGSAIQSNGDSESSDSESGDRESGDSESGDSEGSDSATGDSGNKDDNREQVGPREDVGYEVQSYLEQQRLPSTGSARDSDMEQ